MSTGREEIERTEAPSPRWVAHVREMGAWPISRDLATACAVLSGILALRYAGPSLVARLYTLFSNGLGAATLLVRTEDVAGARGWLLINSGKIALFLLLPMMVALLVGLIQTGGSIRLDLLRPRVERFWGIRVFQQVIDGSTVRATAFASLKLLALVIFVIWSLTYELGRLRVDGGSQSPPAMQSYLAIPLRVTTELACLLVGFGLIDYVAVWVRHLAQLRMTRGELVAEMRELEGDPINRRRQRQRRIDGSHVRWEKLLCNRDLLLLGSGRLALAIRFSDRDQPTLIAKVVGTLADSIERAVRGRGTIVVRHGSLARRVVERGELGKELPMELADQIIRIRSREAEKVAGCS